MSSAEEKTAQVPAVEDVEDDDEFEEFEQENWGAEAEDGAQAAQWSEDWDDDVADDDFCQQLREQLAATASA